MDDYTAPIFEPVLDWIGDWPLAHGERDVPYGSVDSEACLCGRPNYILCPGWLTDGMGSVTISADADGLPVVSRPELGLP